MRWRSALVLSAPAWMLIAWYLWQSVLAHARTVAGTGDAEPLTAETLQLNLHDLLSRDLRRALQGNSVPPQSNLPTFELFLSNTALDGLERQLPPPPDGKGEYVAGELQFRGTRYEVDLRYRGSKHWHWNYPQKSLKLRFREPRHLLSHETVLLLNSPEPEPLLELVILGIAERRGLMVPRYAPVRLLINENAMGLYFLEAPADEATLRYHHRLPWNLYSGDSGPVDRDTGVSQLFQNLASWNKSASPTEDTTGMKELELLLERLAHATPAEFAEFARERLDLESFAILDALDVVFGLDQRNYDENQKFYFDPYRGRFEPVVWNVRGADHDAVVHRAMSPLTQRLEELPEWVVQRNRLVMELLEGEASPEALQRSLEHWDQLLQVPFEQDRFWDATDLLPPAGDYYRDMVRPMTRERQLAARQLLLHRLEERGRWLAAQLSTGELQGSLVELEQAETPKVGPHRYRLTLQRLGLSAVELEQLQVRPQEGCTRPQTSLRRDYLVEGSADRHQGPQHEGPLGQLDLHEELTEGTLRTPRRPHRARGAVELSPESRQYEFLLESSCPLAGVLLRGHLAASLLTFQQELQLSKEGLAESPIPCPTQFVAGPGGRSAHPWCYPALARREVHLGPGVVRLEETTRFDEGTTVIVEPGTTFELGPKASFLVRGKLLAQGTAQAPIRWRRAKSDEAWGVLALLGQGTVGSRLSQVELTGGSSLVDGLTHYTAMLSLQDTSDVSLSDVRVAGATGGDDAVHLAYVRGFTLDRVVISHSASDALDIEYSEGAVTELSALTSGDDALDVMGSKLELMGLRLLGCKDNGISAGEQSDLSVTRALIVGCPTGLLAKNSSTLRVDGVVVAQAERGLRVEQFSEWYAGESQALGAGLWLRSVAHGVSHEGKPLVELTPQTVPDARATELLSSLGVPSWDELETWAAARVAQEAAR